MQEGDQSQQPLTPGQVIQPGAAAPAPPAATPEPAPQSAPQPQAQQPQPEPEIEPAPQPAYDQPTDEVSWTASEFVAHQKNANWYAMLAFGTAVLAAIIFFLTKSIVSPVVVAVLALAFGLYGRHEPRQQRYSLSRSGISIGQQHYDYGNFRSFSVISEGAFTGIVLMPLKRFSLATTIYCAPEDEDVIVGILSDQLPYEEHAQDPVDRLMRRLRF